MFDVAYAMAPAPGGAGGQAGGGGASVFILLFVMFFIFYFLVIRPQQKEAKKQQKMRDSIKKEDRVITAGGMYGKVVGIDDTTLTLEIAEKTRVKFQKAAIASVIPSGGKAGEDEDNNKKK